MLRTIVPDELLQLRLPLSLGIDHVNAYLARADDGRWIVIDCGIADEVSGRLWRDALAQLDAPVSAIVVTHSHPDHVGAARYLSQQTSASVLHSAADEAMAGALWGSSTAVDELGASLRKLGMPAREAEKSCAYQRGVRALVALPERTTIIEPGAEVGGWTVVALPGHAPGCIGIQRRGLLIAGDAILSKITPHVGHDGLSASNPLHDFLMSLTGIERTEPELVAAGHFDVIGNAADRAREIQDHHRRRLDSVEDIVSLWPKASPYALSAHLFGELESPVHRRFALFETMAHLVYLSTAGRIAPVYT